ncbi:MAG: hypothetical protein JJ714_03210 [Acidithiobacillus sp.]|nr:hypothetical protein [Acidithiobacillus sp.]
MCGSRFGITFFFFFSLLFLLCSVPSVYASSFSEDLWEWRYSPSSGYYKVYNPVSFGSHSHLSDYIPKSSSFSSSSAGVLEKIAPAPLTFDGVTGQIIPDVSRSLTVGDLVSSLTDLLKVDNPVGLTIIASTAIAPYVIDAFNSAHPSSSSSSSSSQPFGCAGVNFYWVAYYSNSLCGSCYGASSYPVAGPFASSPSNSFDGQCVCSAVYNGTSGPFGSECSSGTYSRPSVSLSTVERWALSHPNSFSSNLSSSLSSSPSAQLDLARDLASNDAPL